MPQKITPKGAQLISAMLASFSSRGERGRSEKKVRYLGGSNSRVKHNRWRPLTTPAKCHGVIRFLTYRIMTHPFPAPPSVRPLISPLQALIRRMATQEKYPLLPHEPHLGRKFVLVIHGGAGTMSRATSTPEREALYKSALKAALETGYAVLREGGEAMDAAVAAVSVLEGRWCSCQPG